MKLVMQRGKGLHEKIFVYGLCRFSICAGLGLEDKFSGQVLIKKSTNFRSGKSGS